MVKVSKRETAHINIRGVIQGVGFRPFIYQLAMKHELCGWVCNTSEDVRIEIEGNSAMIDRFIADIPRDKPPRSYIEEISVTRHDPAGYETFEIRESIPEEGKYQLVSPDIATCPDCTAEIFDPENRRYRYPFTNCTNCGPRFTIIEDIPYDRPLTTMKNFTMCPECLREYEDPFDRRFHAQPNACPVCGPELSLTDPHGNTVPCKDIITRTIGYIETGKIIALKGLGGFLLACDATSETTVNLLRERKHRPAKPFAVMMASIDEVKKHCEVSAEEENLLLSPGAPIVLLRWKPDSTICEATAPENRYLGVMLPYTPLHHLLLRETDLPLIMTSGNLSEEPIARDNDEALQRLAGIADYFLVHNRDIYAAYDDSVMMVENSKPQILRRARGFAPYPLTLPSPQPQVFAAGAELKSTFCLTRDKYAFISQHIGDMENLETCQHYENTVSLYKKLFRIDAEIIAHDMHPDYLSTQYALELKAENPDVKIVPVQHHHAHIASCMADNGLTAPVIGVAFDGTGYGTDGRIWGGEFLVADFKGFRRLGHFAYLPLPGGEAAIRKPQRIAAGYLYSLFGETGLETAKQYLETVSEEELSIIRQQIDRDINSPLTSSCGRLFDAVSALLGITSEVSYEGQAAIEMEMLACLAEDETGTYSYVTLESDGVNSIQTDELFTSIIADLQEGVEKATIASRFHNTIALILAEICQSISGSTGIMNVALSGGVFQNRLLLRKAVTRLHHAGLNVYTHRQVPTNDGGISLGQAVIAGCSG